MKKESKWIPNHNKISLIPPGALMLYRSIFVRFLAMWQLWSSTLLKKYLRKIDTSIIPNTLPQIWQDQKVCSNQKLRYRFKYTSTYRKRSLNFLSTKLSRSPNCTSSSFSIISFKYYEIVKGAELFPQLIILYKKLLWKISSSSRLTITSSNTPEL